MAITEDTVEHLSELYRARRELRLVIEYCDQVPPWMDDLNRGLSGFREKAVDALGSRSIAARILMEGVAAELKKEIEKVEKDITGLGGELPAEPDK